VAGQTLLFDFPEFPFVSLFRLFCVRNRLVTDRVNGILDEASSWSISQAVAGLLAGLEMVYHDLSRFSDRRPPSFTSALASHSRKLSASLIPSAPPAHLQPCIDPEETPNSFSPSPRIFHFLRPTLLVKVFGQPLLGGHPSFLILELKPVPQPTFSPLLPAQSSPRRRFAHVF